MPIYTNTERFALELVVALRRVGTPAHRLEEAMVRFAQQAHVLVAFYALPTAVVATVRGVAHVVETPVGPPRIDHIDELMELSERVGSHQIDANQGLVALRSLEHAPPRYDGRTVRLGFMLSSACAAGFLGGGLHEVLAGAVVGLLVALWTGLDLGPELGRMVNVVLAFLAAFASFGLASLLGPLAIEVVVLSGLIVVLPGFTLTTALTELAANHRIAGSSGVMAASASLLQLAIGVALGGRLGEAVFGLPQAAEVGSAWPMPLLLVGIAASFVVVLSAKPSHLPWVLGGCGAALVGSQAGAVLLGPDMGVALGALAVCVLGNAASRWARLPAAVCQVPGILLLVPGSVGFRAVAALMEHDVTVGVDTAFATAVAATSLVGGSLVGHALLRPGRPL
jgi:uncharacterized membrane protein YjjP (DUF1212 family)